MKVGPKLKRALLPPKIIYIKLRMKKKLICTSVRPESLTELLAGLLQNAL